MMKYDHGQEFFPDRTEKSDQPKKVLGIIMALSVVLGLCAFLDNTVYDRPDRTVAADVAIKREWDRLIRTGNVEDSDLYLRTTGNAVYMGKKGVDGEVKITRGDPNYETILAYLAHMSLATPEKSQIIETGSPFYVKDSYK